MTGETLTQDQPSYEDVSSHRADVGQRVCGSKHAHGRHQGDSVEEALRR